MDKAGKLHFLTAKGNHLQFSQEFFNEQIMPFLASAGNNDEE